MRDRDQRRRHICHRLDPAIYKQRRRRAWCLPQTRSLLGLRQLYFLIDGLLDRIVFLHYGLAVILGFIGFKLINHALH